MNYRRNEFYTDNEIRFYAELRRKQVLQGIPNSGAITTDEVISGDLRKLWTESNPTWRCLWERREELRQKHKKDLEALEAEALPVSSGKLEPMVE